MVKEGTQSQAWKAITPVKYDEGGMVYCLHLFVDLPILPGIDAMSEKLEEGK